METSPRRLIAMPLLVLLALSSCAQAAAAQSTESRELKPTLRDIEAAWKKRTDAIGSIAMKADVDRFIKGRGDQPAEDVGPFSDSRPISGRVFKVALEYAYEQGKTAFMRSGPIISGDDPEKTEEQTRCHTFDGLEYRTYIKQGTFPQSGSIEKKAVASGPILYMELMAIELWSHPKFVLRAFKSEEMRVEDDLVEVDGTTCRRIRLQRAGSNRLSTIDVNPKLNCVPVQLQNRSGDRPSMKLTIKYDVDPKIGPVVKEWVHTNYDSAGAFQEIHKAKVTQFQLNSDIADERFTIRYPVGTAVVENLGKDKKRRYIQRDSGLEPEGKAEDPRSKGDDPFGAKQNAGRHTRAKFVAFADETKIPGRMTSDELRKAGFTPLSEGDSLTAWDIKPWHKDHWTIKDGVINYDGKAKGEFQDNSLWTKESYGNLQMYAEWRLPETPKLKPTPIVLYNGDFLMGDDGKRVTRPHLDAGDSGLMFRGTSKCQANIWSQELGSGEINGYRTDHKMPQNVRRACIPIKNADRPLGEWNVFLITVKGSRMTTELNGERVIDTPDLPGLPKTGPIGLQHHGDPVQFRQLWVKSIE